MFYPPIIHSSPNWVFPFFLPLSGFMFTFKLSYNVVQFLEHESRSKAVAVRLLVGITFKNHEYLNILMLSTQYRKGLHTRHRATFCPIPITSSFVCYSVILFWTEFQFLPPQTKFPKVMFSQVFVCPQVVCIRGEGMHPGGGMHPGRVCIHGGLPNPLDADPAPIGYYGIQSTSGRYASYCIAFLLDLCRCNTYYKV